MSVVAKFICNEVTKRKHWDSTKDFLYDAKFSPVIGNNEENKKFFEATPTGSISLSTIREDYFEPGKEYYVTFDPLFDHSQTKKEL